MATLSGELPKTTRVIFRGWDTLCNTDQQPEVTLRWNHVFCARGSGEMLLKGITDPYLDSPHACRYRRMG